jgi:hypothetical protein
MEDNQDLKTLRILILRAQREQLSASEIEQLNQLMQTESGAHEAANLIDQLCAFTDAKGLSSAPMTEVLSKAFSAGTPSRTLFDPAESAAATEADEKLSIAHLLVSQSQLAAPTQPQRWTKPFQLLVIAASYLIVASLAWSLAKSFSIDRLASSIAVQPETQRNSSSANLVSSAPQLVSMTACVWRPSGDDVPALGELFQSGEVLKLIEGIAEIKIGEGTLSESLARIEGPASVYIRDDGQLGVLDGSMTVRSLGIGIGNVVLETPAGKVLVDGQSSVGLVSSESANELHVFAGRARIKLNSLGGYGATEIYVEQGEAVSISMKAKEGYPVVKFEASEARFVSARSAGFDPLNLGKKYEQAVLNSKPSIYWRFENLSGELPYYVRNQGSQANMDAALIGEPGWRRYGDNQVAELGKIGFASGFQSTGLWPPQPLEEYTIELWSKPELYHHGELFCMHESEPLKDGRYSHTLMLEVLAQHWRNPLQVYPPNRLRFVHRSPATGDVLDGSNLIADKPYLVRTWQHLAAQKKDGRVFLWIDGKLSTEQPDPEPLDENMRLVIGQLYSTRSERRFVGQIDEVAIYDRCLTPQELRDHIKAAGRAVAPKQTER